MTLTEIHQRVQAIREAAGDYEIAHGLEDKLMLNFIEFIAASDNHKLGVMAEEILRSQDIEFARHCA